MHLKRRVQVFIIAVIFTITSILSLGTSSIRALEDNDQNLLSRQGLNDIENHWAKDYVEGLYNDYIINGYPDGSFKPDNSITRAEMAVILVNALGLTPIANPQLTFNDSNDIEAWSAGYIAKLVELNVIMGYPDGTFLPNKEIERCEIAIMIIKSQNIIVDSNAQTTFADNALIPDWAIGYVAKAAELKIIIGSLVGEEYYFNPTDNATRAEVCVMVDKMRKLNTPNPTPVLTQTPEDTQTQTPTVSPTPMLTQTPEIIQTPTPTITPIPTPTPTPSPTPAPGFNLIPFDKDTTIKAIQPPWKLVGPGGAGAMFTPTVSYTDPNTAMICSDMTGTFITHDGGKQWKIINLRTVVNAIAFDPNDANTIYAASTGLFKSVDGGDSWKLIYPNPDLGVSEKMIGDHAEHSFVGNDNYPGGITQIIYIDPQNSDNIYLGIKTTTLNIYYSKDKGATWTKGSNFTGTGTDFVKMYIDPNSPVDNRGIYAFTNKNLYKLDPTTLTPTVITLPARISTIKDVSCGNNPTTNKSIFYLTTTGQWSGGVYMSGVMKSDNNGSTWTEMQTGLNNDLPATGSGAARYFTSIATALNDARKVYVAVERSGGVAGGTYVGMFTSQDEGVSWDWSLKVGTQYPSNINVGWYEREYDVDWVGAPQHLAVAPNNPNTMYCTGIGIAYATMNGGTTWDQVYSKDNPDGTSTSNGLEVTTTYGVHFDPFDRNHMAISYTDMGLAQSSDGGTSWSHAVNGIPYSWKNTCYWMVFDPAVSGRSWSAWSSCHDLPREKMFRAGRLVDRNYPGGVAKSNDNMASWQVSSNGLPAQTIATHIILDPQSPVGNRTLYVAACGRGVYKSTDDGNTWTLKSNGISSANMNAWRLVLTPDGTLYLLVVRGLVGTTQIDGALYKSTDGADTWQIAPLPAGVNAPNDMISDPTNSLHMYLATWPKKVNNLSESGGLYETTDGGATWKNIFEKTSHVYSVAIDPNDPSTLYIVTFDSAAYMSEDGGKTWSVIKGYDFKWGHRPVPDPYNKGMLYITTFGSSVWYGPAK